MFNVLPPSPDALLAMRDKCADLHRNLSLKMAEASNTGEQYSFGQEFISDWIHKQKDEGLPVHFVFTMLAATLVLIETEYVSLLREQFTHKILAEELSKFLNPKVQQASGQPEENN